MGGINHQKSDGLWHCFTHISHGSPGFPCCSAKKKHHGRGAVHIKPSAVGHGNQAARAVRLRTCPGAREMEVKRGLEWIFRGIFAEILGGILMEFSEV